MLDNNLSSHTTSGSNTQRPLRTRHLPLTPGNPRGSHPDRNGKRLERALGPVVVVVAAQAVDMQRDAGGLRKALQAMRQHLGAEVADALALEPQIDDAIR